MSPVFSVTSWRVVISTLHTWALACTTFRLYRRIVKLRNTWWDDYWACFASVLDVVYFVTSLCLRREASVGAGADAGELYRRIVLFWLTAIFPPLVVWSSRISICMAIARIDIQTTSIRARLWVYALSIAFGMVGSAMLFQKIWVCARTTTWHHTSSVQCSLGKASGYFSLFGDITADSLLTIISLRLLWKVRMRRSRRRLLSWLFGANILSSLAGILYAVLVIYGNKLGSNRTVIISLSAHLKATTTLTVCNLLVVVTYLYAKFWTSPEGSLSENDGSPTTRGDSNLPGGRTTKPSAAGPGTAIILTEFTSQGSVMSWTQRIPRGVTSTFLTWAGSELGFVVRGAPAALRSTRQISGLDSNPREENLGMSTASQGPDPSSLNRTDSNSSAMHNNPQPSSTTATVSNLRTSLEKENT